MKTKYFALLIAAMGSSLSLGASISNLESAYSKNSTVYDGTNGDTLDVSTPTTLNVNANGSWTMAFTVSNLTATSDSNVGLLFTYCCLPTIPDLITIWKEWAISWRRTEHSP